MRYDEGLESVDDSAGLDATDRRNPLYWVGDSTHQHGYAGDNGASPGFGPVAGALYDEALRLMLGRHADYGPYNIAHAWPDPLTALVVRMSDKMERIKNLLRKGEGDVYGERARDSWLDTMNYAAIGCLVIDGSWPGLRPSSNRTPTN